MHEKTGIVLALVIMQRSILNQLQIKTLFIWAELWLR
jgi:hypothetical protein